MQLFGEALGFGTAVFLVLALLLALSFEFVNGFHDTANAVATVIYTHSLKPTHAVVWSGCWNLIGVLASGGAVAYGIISLLPVELVIHIGSAAGFAMVFALLISAIIWNIGTWYLGLPASSSHTLIGSIMGVGLANSMLSGAHFGDGVNWSKAREVFASLLVSPLVGFGCAALLLILAKIFLRRPELFQPPEKDKAPPHWIRALLVLTCTGVSFAHGSNDGQKGMGLLMLILIGIVPGAFALNLGIKNADLQNLARQSHAITATMTRYERGVPDAVAGDTLSRFLKPDGKADDETYAALAAKNDEIGRELDRLTSLASMQKSDRGVLRSNIYLVAESIGKLDKKSELGDRVQSKTLKGYQHQLETLTKYIPTWVKIGVALALGLGTMIGWKRIVVTVGEKIGKEHLTYAQGAAAELVAMATIGAADRWGLPVSTTHVLSSGIAGTMAANKSGLQFDTVRNLLLAWVLTLPVCVLLGAGAFSAGFYIIFHILGLR